MTDTTNTNVHTERNAKRAAIPSAAAIDLRDWFAGLAMQGLISCPSTDGYKNDYAKWAYEYADEMLKRREKS